MSKKIFILISLMILITSAKTAAAASRAIFPDIRTLQPSQSTAKPNVSGSINYSESQQNDDEDTSNNDYQNNEISNIDPQEENTGSDNDSLAPTGTDSDSSSFSLIWLNILLVLAILLAILLITKKISQRME